ncbi:MAG: PIN domain-containing protein [Acidobacteriia bacterium]|nr:PIN domain-containing protein [Terriglobia bacterium]
MAADKLCFVDTNVLLYSVDAANAAKQKSAQRWLDALWSRGAGRLSWQVLNEFYANATGKIGAPPGAIRSLTRFYSFWNPAGFHLGLVERGWYWADHAQLNYWDALVLAAAESLGCSWLLSEDFQSGRVYGSVRTLDPFRTDPGAFLQR